MMQRLTALASACLCALAITAGSGHAQAPPTADQIIERLKSGAGAGAGPAPRATRGISAPQATPGSAPSPIAPAAAPSATPGGAPPSATAGGAPPSATAGALSVPTPRRDEAVDRLFTAPPRNISAGEREKVAEIAAIKPTIDLTIYFDFDSAEIGPRAIPGLVELGKALASDALKGSRILLAGHTDGKGGDAYNLRLSQRRAEAIKRFLITQFRVEEQRLLAIGYGKEQLKNKAQPFADENRRVQVVNFGS